VQCNVRVSALRQPFGIGRFTSTGEGFCYADFHDKALAAIMLVVTLGAMLPTIGLLASLLVHGGWPVGDLWLMLLGFVSAWVLWPPASIIGLSGSAFPQHYMISGGILGHAQAIVNPIVYGLRWRSTVVGAGAGAAPMSKMKPSDSVTGDLGATPEQGAALA